MPPPSARDPAFPAASESSPLQKLDATFRRLEGFVQSFKDDLVDAEEAPPAPPGPTPGDAQAEPAPSWTGGESHLESHGNKLALLRSLLGQNEPTLVPDLDAEAPRGHSFGEIEARFRLEKGASLPLLEELADLGLLDRSLHNLVHLCPACHRCQINFRENCPYCDQIDIRIERLVHHFACAYVGLESEFVQGIHLVCPKCRKHLHQLGQDFERPNDTYVCRACTQLFEEPVVRGQCLGCGRESAGDRLEMARVHRYSPTPLTVRAVELQRLTGLNLSEVMFDTELRLASHDFLVLEAEREVFRLNRYRTPFSGALLYFTHGDELYPVFREWSTETLQELGELLAKNHRQLDLIAKMDNSHVGLLFPETGPAGLEVVRQRILAALTEVRPTTRHGQELGLGWSHRSWETDGTSADEVRGFFESWEEGEP